MLKKNKPQNISQTKKPALFFKNLIELFSFWRWGWSFTLQLAIFVLAGVFFAAVAFVVGHSYLFDNFLWGNDTLAAYTYQTWFAQWFPHIPFWWPYQGGSIGYFSGYPWGSYLLVTIVERLTSLNLVQAFRLVGWASVPLTAWGIFAFCWLRLNRPKEALAKQLLGLIAGFFYVISPLAWIWLVQWGFYAESVSHFLVPITVICLDWFIDRILAKKGGFKTRLAFFLTAVFWLIAFLIHFNAGIVIGGVAGLLAFFKAIWSRRDKWPRLKRIFLSLAVLMIVTLLLFSFRHFALNDYMAQVAKGGFVGYSPNPTDEDILHNTLRYKTMLGLSTPKQTEWEYVIHNMRFPIYVWLLALAGWVLGWPLSPTIAVFGLISLVAFLSNTSLWFYKFVIKWPFPLGYIFSGRTVLVLLRFTLPIVAAFGALVIWEWFFVPLEWVFKKIKIVWFMFQPVRFLAILSLTLLTASLVFIQTYYWPNKTVWAANVGAFTDEGFAFDLRDIWQRVDVEHQTYIDKMLTDNSWYLSKVNLPLLGDICKKEKDKGGNLPLVCQDVLSEDKGLFNLASKQLIKDTGRQCAEMKYADFAQKMPWCQVFYQPLWWQLKWENWPEINISSSIKGEINEVNEKIFSYLPKDRFGRMDISGFSGKLVMMAPLLTQWSSIQAYTNNLPLIYNSQNYLARVMYSDYFQEQKPGVLDELARWFGLEYALVSGERNPQYWQSDKEWRQNKEEPLWWQFSNPTGILSWETKPALLAISDNSKYFYDQTFKLFNWGGLKYNQATMINGPAKIDKLNIKDLQNFEVVFMRAYKYGIRSRAYQLLDRYVAEGGSLIIDTGWQYEVPDWQLDKAPQFLPFYNLEWHKNNGQETFKFEDDQLTKDLSKEEFGDLKWEDVGWGISTPKKLRPWGKTVLSVGNKPVVVVGEYGKGRVVWIGFNLLAHAEAKDSVEEMKFFNHLLEWSMKGFKQPENLVVSYQRDNPDEINFQLNQAVKTDSWLFWRESWYPSWKAVLQKNDGSQENVKIWRGGPGFMALKLPAVKNGDKINLKHHTSWRQKTWNFVSLSVFVLIFLSLFGIFVKIEKKCLKIFSAVDKHFSSPIKIWKKIRKKFFAFWENEDS